MAQKKITDLTLRSDFDATVNLPGDDTSQTWRVTGAQILAYIKSAMKVITGSADEIQQRIIGNATQSTAPEILLVEKSDGTDLLAVTNVNGTKIKGTTTNDSAAAGNVGEYVESVGVFTVAFGNGTFGDATSISLTAGDWDVTGMLDYTINTAVSWTNISTGISTTSGNSATGLSYGSNRVLIGPPTSNYDSQAVISNYRISLSATTTVYLKSACSYASGTPASNGGRLSARRVR